ncbi:anti-sigma regulatory factor [Piscinibacter sakaiensis]|uniref:anti-sigma regulatory factor n=1 Tax=Piscinibacter sakaiensis TaxID=1547922 RepID=UPI003AADF876
MTGAVVIEIRTSEQVSSARRVVQARAAAIGLSTLETTKFVTAVSELARNLLVHGGGGSMTMRDIDRDGRPGLQLDFEDQGPGIADVQQALRDGFSTANSLGLGLGGAQRLVQHFEIVSSLPGAGTHVRIAQWKRR